MRLTRTPIAGVREWLERMELTVDLTEMTGDLPLPTLRMLDLARALARDPQLLMLDEITAALPSDLAEKVFTVMREWRERGRSVLFISHRLAEVSATCDRASVLRDGRTVGTLVPKAGEEEKIVELMLGETRSKLAQQIEAEVSEAEGAAVEVAAEAGETQLEVRNLVVGDDPGGVSFSVRAGEILGVAALEGQGQDLLFDYLAGERKPHGRRDARRRQAAHPGPSVRGDPLRRRARPGRPHARPAAAAADPREHRRPALQPHLALGADQPRRREPPRVRTRSSACRSTRARSARRAGSPAATSRS